MENMPDTIAAISTPIGRGGIGIIRLSGANAFSIVQTISKTAANLNDYDNLTIRKTIHGYIKNNKDETIDEVLICFMPASKSFTGEPVVEINCHGGRAVLSLVLGEVIAGGAKLAEPGGFTRRAVENGRIDLIQAEAINDIINARSEKALQIALKQVEGGLTKRYKYLRNQLVDILSKIQAQVDFEVDESLLDRPGWSNLLQTMEVTIETMLKSSKMRKYMDHGVWIALVGPPNAGKSSLFNAILNIERAIVCEEPGTTRDHISEIIDIEGVEVKLTDTAGMRQSDDKIELLSIDRSKQQIESSDLILYVIDQSQDVNLSEESEIVKLVKEKGLMVLNKCDLPLSNSVKNLIERHQLPTSSVSAIGGDGVDDLLDVIASWMSTSFPNTEDPIVTSLRQTKLLESANKHIEEAIKSLDQTNQLDIVCYEIEHAINSLKSIVGEIDIEHIYGRIFSKFCIGK